MDNYTVKKMMVHGHLVDVKVYPAKTVPEPNSQLANKDGKHPWEKRKFKRAAGTQPAKQPKPPAR